jgi:hypothetical protein
MSVVALCELAVALTSSHLRVTPSRHIDESRKAAGSENVSRRAAILRAVVKS